MKSTNNLSWHYHLRFARVINSLGICDKSRMILYCLLVDDKPWRVQTLADYIGCSRASVRHRLQSGHSGGVATRDPVEGWTLTPMGREFYTELFTEAHDIASGSRRWYSPGLIRRIRAVTTAGVRNNSARTYRVPTRPL